MGNANHQSQSLPSLVTTSAQQIGSLFAPKALRTAMNARPIVQVKNTLRLVNANHQSQSLPSLVTTSAQQIGSLYVPKALLIAMNASHQSQSLPSLVTTSARLIGSLFVPRVLLTAMNARPIVQVSRTLSWVSVRSLQRSVHVTESFIQSVVMMAIPTTMYVLHNVRVLRRGRQHQVSVEWTCGYDVVN